MEKHKTKPKGWLGPFIVLVVLFFLCIAGIVLGVLGSRALLPHNKETPQQAVLSYLDALSVGDFQQINQNATFSPSILCSWQDYDRYLLEPFHGNFADLTLEPLQGLPDSTPAFLVLRGGKPLTRVYLQQGHSQDSWQVFPFFEDDYLPYKIVAPEHLTVSINGVALPPDNIIATTPVAGFEDLPDNMDSPFCYTYETPPLIGKPDITAFSQLGTPGKLSLNTKSRQAEFTFPLLDDIETRQFLEDVFSTYSGYQSGDTDFKDIEPLLLSGTALYQNLEQSAKEPRKQQLTFLKIGDLQGWSEDAFSGTIEFQRQPSTSKEDELESASMQLHFIRVKDNWLLAGLTVD